MPSRTALVLASQGDPIFGAIARRLIKPIIRGATSIVRTVKGTLQTVLGSTSTGIVRSPQTGQLVRVAAKSKVARVLAEGVALGAVAGGTSIAVRSRFDPSFPGRVDPRLGTEGCPTGKVVEVAAHQRIIPLDRFGRPRRRIDVLNTKALARATRRLGGFQKRARRVEKQLARIAPRSRSRRRSKGVC